MDQDRRRQKLCLNKGLQLLFIPSSLMPRISPITSALSFKVELLDPSELCRNPQAGVSLGDRDRQQEALQQRGLLMNCEFAATDPAVGF